MPDVDPNGIAHIREDDPRAPFSDLMRLITEPLSTVIDGIRSRLTTIEGNAGGDSGWTLAAITPATGWDGLSGPGMRKVGKMVEGRFGITRNGATITADSTGGYQGNVGDVLMATIADGFRPSGMAPRVMFSSGLSGTARVDASGQLWLETLNATGNTLPDNHAVYFTFQYFTG